jgi:hypothetical protein
MRPVTEGKRLVTLKLAVSILLFSPALASAQHGPLIDDDPHSIESRNGKFFAIPGRVDRGLPPSRSRTRGATMGDAALEHLALPLR